MIECVSAGMPELGSAIQRARRTLQDMEEAPKLGGHSTAIQIIIVFPINELLFY